MARAIRTSGKLVRIILLVGMLLTALPGASMAQGTSAIVNPTSATVAIGGTTTVSIRIEGVTDLYGAEVHLTFSPGIVQVVDADGDATNGVQVATGDIFGGKNAFNALNAANNSTGTIDYAISLLGEPAGVTGSGSLLNVTFQGASQGLSAVGFVTVMLASRAGGQITATTVNGTINVASASSPSATPSPTATVPTSTPTATPTGTTQVQPTATPTKTSTTAPDTQCTYVVKWGDTLYSIAPRYGTTVSVLVSLNGLANPNYIYVGQTLYLPCGAVTPVPPTTTPVPGGCNGFYYTVVAGDTLYSIANRYGTTLQAITAVNYIPNVNYIYVGQKLCIPTGQPGPTPTPQTGGCTAYYTVKAGDTLIGIAATYGTTYWAIAMANNISNPNLIYPGTTLCIP